MKGLQDSNKLLHMEKHALWLAYLKSSFYAQDNKETRDIIFRFLHKERGWERGSEREREGGEGE